MKKGGMAGKKIVLIVIVAIQLSMIFSCSAFYRSLAPRPAWRTRFWQTVTISDIGSFRIPKKWYVEQLDEFLLITNKPIKEEGYTIYFIGSVSMSGNTKGVASAPHSFFAGMEQGRYLSSAGYQYGGIRLELYEYLLDDDIEERFLIEFCNKYISGKCNHVYLLSSNCDIDWYVASQVTLTWQAE
jgi:hypothetical protein